MPKAITTYECQVCGAEFATENEAILCEQQEFNPKFKAGDILTTGQGFGWYDGDKLWVSNPDIKVKPKVCPNRHGNCFSECCTYHFYYVVSFVDCTPNGHRPRYHLVTGAMSGKQGYARGFVYDLDYTPNLVTKPLQKLRNDAQRFVGQKSDYLL